MPNIQDWAEKYYSNPYNTLWETFFHNESSGDYCEINWTVFQDIVFEKSIDELMSYLPNPTNKQKKEFKLIIKKIKKAGDDYSENHVKELDFFLKDFEK